MELELGLKLTSAADEFTSDFTIAKDRAGPVFMSRETDTMFFLTAHLKGYKRRNIKIDINEDGSLIGISGERQVKETVMVGWKVYKKDTEIKGFKKVFRIPDGVILDKIKAKFNDDESTLTITMTKKIKGIRGATIEEVKDKPELVREGSGSLQISDEKSPKTTEQLPKEEKPVSDHDLKDGEEGQLPSPSIHGEFAHVEADTCKEGEEKQRNTDDIQEINEPQQDQEVLDRAESLSMRHHEMKDQPETYKQVPDERSDEEKVGPSTVEPSEEASEAEPGKVEDGEEKPQAKRCKMCIPIVAGSTLLLTFVVFVIQIIRSKHQTRKRD
ncbi:HSP20-like chaperones superfamily protein [Perilla frutescens var. hirtella]|nr:HSP20-like chaperones superfamily protein [Perilla frutescens var. hirtella]